MTKPIKVGVISDTHGFINSEIYTIFNDVDHILHAGDIGTEEILEELRLLAPVTAVQGNGDYFTGWQRYRQVEMIRFNGKTLLLTHELDPPPRLSHPMGELIAANKPDSVIYGHSHFPYNREDDGVLYFNPGRAGKDSYSTSPTLGILFIGKDIEAEIIPLDEDNF